MNNLKPILFVLHQHHWLSTKSVRVVFFFSNLLCVSPNTYADFLCIIPKNGDKTPMTTVNRVAQDRGNRRKEKSENEVEAEKKNNNSAVMLDEFFDD